MNPVEEVAQLLIRQFNMPAKMHSVWIRTELGDEATGREARNVIMVAVHPNCPVFPAVPEQFMGIPVRMVPWQPDDVRDHQDWHDKIMEIAQAVL